MSAPDKKKSKVSEEMAAEDEVQRNEEAEKDDLVKKLQEEVSAYKRVLRETRAELGEVRATNGDYAERLNELSYEVERVTLENDTLRARVREMEREQEAARSRIGSAEEEVIAPVCGSIKKAKRSAVEMDGEEQNGSPRKRIRPSPVDHMAQVGDGAFNVADNVPPPTPPPQSPVAVVEQPREPGDRHYGYHAVLVDTPDPLLRCTPSDHHRDVGTVAVRLLNLKRSIKNHLQAMVETWPI